MDAQMTLADTAGLVALIQSLVRLEVDGERPNVPIATEVVDENRFLAARDGLSARLIDPIGPRLVPVREIVPPLLAACRQHAAALGCSCELDQVRRLAAANGALRQREWAIDASDLATIAPKLAGRFLQPRQIGSHPTLEERTD